MTATPRPPLSLPATSSPVRAAVVAAFALLTGCGAPPARQDATPLVRAEAGGAPATTPAARADGASPVAATTRVARPDATPVARTEADGAPATTLAARADGASPVAATTRIAPATRPEDLPTPDPVPFEQAVGRAAQRLLQEAAANVGGEPRTVVIDPLVDAGTGAQTTSTVQMGTLIEGQVRRRVGWQLKPLTRASLSEQPLLVIGTLTPNTARRTVDTVADGYRVWLSVIDLRTGRLVAKQLDRATPETVDAQPLKFYADSPTWHRDRTVEGYINSCQIKTAIGDPADPEYLKRLPAVAIVNEAIAAYSVGKLPRARALYEEAAPLADPDDLRVLNGLYLTNWSLGAKDAARDVFGRLVTSGLKLRRLPLKLLFTPGTTTFQSTGDLPAQYQLWLDLLARQAMNAQACIDVVGHTSRTGSASVNERLSRQRAEAVKALLERHQRSLASRLRASGVGSREALVGLGTDDLRDALDRRVEFKVAGCV